MMCVTGVDRRCRKVGKGVLGDGARGGRREATAARAGAGACSGEEGRQGWRGGEVAGDGGLLDLPANEGRGWAGGKRPLEVLI